MGASRWLPQIELALCTGCGHCIAICPTKALGWHGTQAGVVNPEACTYDARCEAICPVDAIALPYQIVMDAGWSDGPSTEYDRRRIAIHARRRAS